MSIQSTTHLNVDFYNKEYIMVNAKQYDNSSRWITITCYDQGKIFNLSASKHTAYIRYKKADGYGVLNICKINYKGEVLVELTEQMLAADGICYVDLIIVDKGSAMVNIDTGEVITIDGSTIMSTMAFCVNVYEATVDNSFIESSYEYDALNELLQRADANYQEVVQLAKSYAIGDANNTRENEDFDNSKYYSQLSRSYAIGDADGVRANENVDNAKYYSKQSANSANSADKSEAKALEYKNTTNQYMDATKGYMNTTKEYMNTTNSYMTTTQGYMNTTQSYMVTTDGYMDATKSHMDKANTYMNNAKTSETNAATSESNALTSESNAETYMNSAKEYMEATQISEANASTSANNALTSETNAKTSETNADASADAALISEANASVSEENALTYSIAAQRYAVGGTGTVDGEDIDNSKYYYQLALENANKSVDSATSALNSASSASVSAENAYNSEVSASQSASDADISKTNANESANSASDSADIAVLNANNASTSASSAYESASSALESENAAKEYSVVAENSMNSAVDSATSASESASEAHTYYLQVEEITTGLSGAFMPMGTIEFSELTTLLESGEIKAGHLYNISDNFVTDDTFKRGSGIEYAAGTNVYLTSEGYFDCLTGTTVTGVKGENETEYRKGNVNITPENIGAVSINDVATVDDVKSYLGI